MTIIKFTNEILKRGGKITKEGDGISVLLNNTRFTLLTNLDGIIGVGGDFFGDYYIREHDDLYQALDTILGFA